MEDKEPTELENFLTACDNFGFRMHYQRILDSRITGEDGKEYFRLNLPPRYFFTENVSKEEFRAMWPEGSQLGPMSRPDLK